MSRPLQNRPQAPKNRLQSRTGSGFTLIEVLMALALIALLASILFIGGQSIMKGAREKSTKVTLAALKGMLSEYDAKTRLGRTPRTWRWFETSSSVSLPTTTTPNNSVDFWRVPYHGTAERTLDALDAPGTITEDELLRNASRQVLNTQLAMGLILQMPANRSALSRIPADRYFLPTISNSLTGTLITPGPDGVLTAADNTTEGWYFPAGVQVLYRDTSGQVAQEKRFICANSAVSNFQGTTSAPPTSGWKEDRGPANPILLDAWNNPIIFVPGTGLRLRLLNGKSSFDAADINQTAIVISPEGKVDKQIDSPPRVIQAGRPFFASAGPDGDFSKGDDNIYSFEQ